MKKFIGAIAGFVVAVAAVAAFSGSSTPVSATDNCVSGSKYTDFDGSYTGRDTMTVWTKGNKPLCKDVNVNFTSFTVHNKYNGKGFKNNPTALPQSSFYNKTVTLKKGTNGKTTVKVSVPDACTDYQIDAYVGPVQTKITTNEGLVNTTAIVGKLFQRTKQTCTVQVCNPATGQIITVKESEAAKYKPVGDEACKNIKVCDLKSGKIITIKGYQFNSSKHSKDLNSAACKPATPNKINVCVIATGDVIEIDENKFDATTQTKDLTKCEEVPVVPETPEVKGEETPEVLPSTGPAEALSALFGTGALAGTTTAYVRSRRAIRK